MINYGETSIQVIGDNRIRVFAEMCVTNDFPEQTTMSFGTPAYWDNALVDSLGPYYDFFEISTKIIPHTKCSRITDYKQVWGLSNKTKGIFSSQLDFEKSRLYFGLTPITHGQFLSSLENAFLVIPHAEQQLIVQIWNGFADALQEEKQYDIINGLKKVVQIFPNCIALHYSCLPAAELTILCNTPFDLADRMESCCSLHPTSVHCRLLK